MSALVAIQAAFASVSARADDTQSYDNWFTDADQLTSPDATPWLDRALANHDPELIASLPVEETNAATPAQLATLLNDVSQAGFGSRQAQWALALAQNPRARVPEALDELSRRGQLGQFIERFPNSERGQFVSALVDRLGSGSTIGEMIVPLLVEDSHDSKLLAHHLMDRARALGAAASEEARRVLAGEESWNGNIAQFISEAFPERLPLVIAHRGGNSEKYPENTLELVESTLREGLADGIEIDISVTKDHVPILWHDIDPNEFVAILRAAGLEGDSFRPHEDPSADGKRHPVWDLTLRKLRSLFHYVRSADSELAPYSAPRLHDVLKAVHDLKPDLKIVLLDIKVPASRPADLQTIVDDVLAAEKQYPIQGKIVMLHTESEGVRFLKARSQGVYDVSHDYVFGQPVTDLASFMKSAREADLEGAGYVSMGKPVVSQVGFSGYLAAVRSNMDWLEETGTEHPFMAWTINDELEFRELMGTGVHAILTDQVPAMRQMLGRYGRN